MKTKTINISLPQIEGVELKNATVDLKNGVVTVEYGEEERQEDIRKDISEIAVDSESAIDYLLEGTPHASFRTTKKHIPKLDALNQLIILAEAWNSFDEFKPDWENQEQYKWYPAFKSNDGKLEFSCVGVAQFITNTHISNFSFKTEKRAEQFGKQFIELFRIVLTN